MDNSEFLRFKSAPKHCVTTSMLQIVKANGNGSGLCIRFYKLRRLLRPPNSDWPSDCGMWKCVLPGPPRANAEQLREHLTSSPKRSCAPAMTPYCKIL